jgi:hypothetical protein
MLKYFRKQLNKLDLTNHQIDIISNHFSERLADHVTTFLVVCAYAGVFYGISRIIGFEFMVFILFGLLFLKRT